MTDDEHATHPRGRGPAAHAWIWFAVGWLTSTLLIEDVERASLGAPRAETHTALPVEPTPSFERMTVRELRRLPGIGDARAVAIARARWERGLRGGPRALEELAGIGPATIAGIEAWFAESQSEASDLHRDASERTLSRDVEPAIGPRDVGTAPASPRTAPILPRARRR